MAEIPKYLDNYIFNELGGEFKPGLNVDVNLNNDESANKRYIGTYFPRSLVESYFIMQDLYAHRRIKQVIDQKQNLKILDIGTGTGGNIIGLLHFLKSNNFINKPVDIYTVEGNNNAIEFQRQFFRRFNQTFRTNYTLHYANIVFSTQTLDNQLTQFLNRLNISFDIITSFKFVSEFYNSEYQNSAGIFHDFAKTLSQFLNQNGLFLLLDLVSGDYEHRNMRPFTTQIMSDELNKYVKNPTSNLAYILPICCGFWSHECRTKLCYIERQFKIEHSRSRNDKSKVTYRVMVPKPLADLILSDIEEKEQYQMSYNNWHPRYCRKTTIIERTNENELPNAFKFL